MSRSKFMSSSNPFVSEKKFSQNNLGTVSNDGVMTVQGTVQKTLILTTIVLITAVLSWNFLFTPAFFPYLMPMLLGSMFGGMAVAFIAYRKPNIAHILAPIYAVLEGILLGLFSAFVATQVSGGDFNNPNVGIVFNAILLTIMCLLSMIGLYKFEIIKPTEKFRSIVSTGVGAVMLVYITSIGLGFFGINIPYLHEGGVIGIGLSIFIIGLANMKLIVDLDNIVRGARSGAAKQMEWVCSLGLLVTLVWIYWEILILLRNLQD